jgi:uncharacterized membrane-anchored protein YitT (DUF2179 family)
MYWWNASKLAEDLREGRVDEKQRFNYFLATFIALTLVVHVFSHYGALFPGERLIPVALNLIFTVIGISLCYRANKSGDNKDFIARIICLGWPSGIRTMVLVLALALLVVATFSMETTIPNAIGRSLWFSWVLIWLYYSMVSMYISRCAQGKGAENTSIFGRLWRSSQKRT